MKKKLGAPPHSRYNLQMKSRKKTTDDSGFMHNSEFLSALIDASVDGIIAADMKGHILLFSHSAELIFGYAKDEVVGKMHVTDFYSVFEARNVMRQLTSDTDGEYGVTPQIEIEARGKHGNSIPLSLTCSMYYDGDLPAGTVGYFKDLRERLTIENKLKEVEFALHTQREKGLVLELAGAAAHELNQPLQAISASIELLFKKLDPASKESALRDLVFSQLERMVDIVKHIGTMATIERKAYVGNQQILEIYPHDEK